MDNKVNESILKFKDSEGTIIQLDKANQLIIIDGKSVYASYKHFNFILYLLSHSGGYITTNGLFEWFCNNEKFTKVIVYKDIIVVARSNISQFKKKLRELGYKNDFFIERVSSHKQFIHLEKIT